MPMDRRTFLELAAFLAAASPFNACCLVKKVKATCPWDPRFSDRNTPLAIDTHAHIFNATDLQVRDFVSLVAVRQDGALGELAEYFGTLVQWITWGVAPDVGRERLKLEALKPDIMACNTDQIVGAMKSLRNDEYNKAVAELQRATNAEMDARDIDRSQLSEPMEVLEPTSRGFKQILELPESYEELFAGDLDQSLAFEDLAESKTIQSILRFIIEMFQYRFVSVYNYLETYNTNPDLKIDLIAPAPVDYDYWLSRGNATESSLPDQMTLMGEISVLSGGRVHALVPFDPYRQVVHDLGLDSGFSPIDLVKTSVEQHGAIGIKLYPPMGFAPYGNVDVAEEFPDMWKGRSWLTDVAEQDAFPEMLDASLAKLYQFCAAEEVPVMGHSNRSNGPIEEFEELASPPHWAAAAESFPEVSFSFGHFGGVGSIDDGGLSDAEAFLALMAGDQDAGSTRLRADASYFSKLLDDPAVISSALEFIYSYGDADPKPAVARLMYGADWKMLVAEENADQYLRVFEEVITEIGEGLPDGSGLAEMFFGRNAADFFGLRQGRKNRSRLDQFYDRNGFTTEPFWMTKVDSQQP